MQDCILSIKNQAFKDFEVWVIDNNSTDGTREYLKTLKAPFNSLSEKDNGVYEAMNKGISLSKGNWLFFIGADDEFYNEFVLSEIFSSKIDNKYSLISGNIIYTSNESQFIYSKKKIEKKASWSFSIWIRNSLHHQSTFYRNEIFNGIKYNTNFSVLADYHLNLLLYINKNKCFIKNIIVATCSGNGISKSGNWSIYKEEISLKTQQSSKLYLPFFFIIASLKYLLGKSAKNK